MSLSGLTDQQYHLLSQFAYADIVDQPENALKDFKDKSLREIIEHMRVENNGSPRVFTGYGGLTNAEKWEVMNEIAQDPVLGNLRLKDYCNQNEEGGFVGYAFYDGDDPSNTLFAFRGSEGEQVGEDAFLGGKLKEDWIDNFRLGLRSYSAQFEATYKFVEENNFI